MDKANCLAPLGTRACRIKELTKVGWKEKKHLPPGLGMRFQTPVWITYIVSHMGKEACMTLHGLGPKLIIGTMSVNTAECPPLQIHTHSYRSPREISVPSEGVDRRVSQSTVHVPSDSPPSFSSLFWRRSSAWLGFRPSGGFHTRMLKNRGTA